MNDTGLLFTECPYDVLDIVIVLDESGSIVHNTIPNQRLLYNWNLINKFIVNIINEFGRVGSTDGNRFSLITFSDTAKIQIKLSQFDNQLTQLTDMIDLLEYR